MPFTPTHAETFQSHCLSTQPRGTHTLLSGPNLGRNVHTEDDDDEDEDDRCAVDVAKLLFCWWPKWCPSADDISAQLAGGDQFYLTAEHRWVIRW